MSFLTESEIDKILEVYPPKSFVPSLAVLDELSYAYSCRGMEDGVAFYLNDRDYCWSQTWPWGEFENGDKRYRQFRVLPNDARAIAPRSSKWIVTNFGDNEISICRNNNTHGLSSYGWFDENKILVAYLHPRESRLVKPDRDILLGVLKLAKQLAERKNKEEQVV